MLPADYVFGAAVALIVASNLYFGSRIEQTRVAMQWRSDGEAAWRAPKWLAIWGVVFFMVAVRFVIWLASAYAPSSVHSAEPGIVIFSAVVAGSHLFVLMKARTERWTE